ncbi:MAG: ABC transporter ATP-binding protein [Solirubrobacterales bacterium]
MQVIDKRSETEPILGVDGLSVSFEGTNGTVRALRGATLSLRPGEVMGLVGESGSGKSVLAWSAVGLTPPPGEIVAGQVTFRGRSLVKDGTLDEGVRRRLAGSEIGLVVQNARAHLNPLVRVGDQLANVARVRPGVSAGDARAAAVEMLARVALSERSARAYPHELSGGMAQRVLIAMAAINGPAVLFADEPTMGLDVTIQAQVLDVLSAETQRLSSSLCLVTRDLGIVANYCQTVGVIRQGQVLEVTSVEEFFAGATHPYSRSLLAAATLGEHSRATGVRR